MLRLFEEMGAETAADPMKEEDIVRCKELYQEGNLGHNQTDVTMCTLRLRETAQAEA